jgi:hypothetical protein
VVSLCVHSTLGNFAFNQFDNANLGHHVHLDGDLNLEFSDVDRAFSHPRIREPHSLRWER